MSNFTKLEEAALHAIFAETPEQASILEQQFEQAEVINRENTGKGFFTTIAVSKNAPRVNSPEILGHETHAYIDGPIYGLGFVLFMENGWLHLLEGFAIGPESTEALDFTDLTFTITKTPFDL